jgi:serine/threonine protein kinase
MPLETLQNGRYRILRTLGSGSMGEVYLVDDTRINRQVAIKVIRAEIVSYPDQTPSQDAARLFEREAKAIARLNHPNILPLYDFGDEVINNTPFAYMVMPYCPAGSLASWLQQRGSTPLSPQEALHFLEQAADALQHAHDNGIIHQDVKPQNFLLRSHNDMELPDLLLADFGIAKLTAGTSGASQAIRGTPIYMAPEQWEGHPVPASDQYALATMIYQLLTGRPPFQGGPGQMMYQHFSVTPQPPSAFNPAISPDIDAVLLRALAKKPEERFPSISAFSHAFQQALHLNIPTTSSILTRPNPEGIRATLAISPEEARRGANRTLTLAGGQHISVAIPPGMQDGNIIHATGRDNSDPNTTIPLLLTIAVAPTGNSLPTFLGNDALTVANSLPALPDTSRPRMTSNPNLMSTEKQGTISSQPTVVSNNDAPNDKNIILPSPVPVHDAPVYNNQLATPPTQPPSNSATDVAERRSRFSPALALLMGILAVLLILGSTVFFYYLAASNSHTANLGGTATALAHNGTVTSQGNAQATDTAQGQANAYATATANAQNQTNANQTATAYAQNNGNATATANTQTYATATANANATATANASATAQAATATATASSATFTVQSVSISVNPTSISGTTCGTYITVTYTATFVVPANTPGGTIQFAYSVNNGRSQQNASITFAAGQTTKTYDFTWSGNLPADHTYPGVGIVMTTSPNQVTSQGVAPTGQCS